MRDNKSKLIPSRVSLTYFPSNLCLYQSFSAGFDMNIPYDNRVVRMCFQVILEGENGKYTVPLTPIVSDPIYDKKNYSELVLAEISECCCEVEEEKKIIILCGKVILML